MRSIVTRPYQSEDWLREQYHDQRKTMREIAAECDTTENTIHRWIHRHGIATRSGGAVVDGRLDDPEWLESQYWEDGLTLHEIAAECDCSAHTVMKRFQEYGIETRQQGWAIIDE